MRTQHYDIDGLVQYGSEEIPGTQEVINPAWRTLDKAVWATRQQLRKLQGQTRRWPVAGRQPGNPGKRRMFAGNRSA